MTELSSENWMGIITVSAIFMWGIAILLFSRISMNHIEREMAKEDILPPTWDKGIGARMIAYASIIAFPNLNRHASLVDIEATKRFSRKKDKKFAVLLIVTSIIIFSVLGVFSIFFSPDN